MNAKHLRRSRQAALEGMPLYLIILVVIAAASVAVIMTWVSKMDSDPVNTISVDALENNTNTVIKASDFQRTAPKIYVYVYDDEGNKLNAAAVTVKGCGLNGAGITKKDRTNGNCFLLNDQMLSLPPDQSSGIITVTAMTADGLTAECTMMVVRCV